MVDVADGADVQVRLAPGVDVVGRVGGEASPRVEQREQGAAERRRRLMNDADGRRRRHRH